MPVQYGEVIVFGIKERRPIVNLPPDALKVKVRMRVGKPGKAFVKFHDRIEGWVIGYENNCIAKDSWILRFKEGENLCSGTSQI